MSLFVDTSCWYATLDRNDSDHQSTTALLEDNPDLVLTDHVLIETWRLVRHRLGGATAERFWSSVRDGLAQVEFVGPADLEAAWRIGEAFPDQDLSPVDRTSFAVMERLRIRQVASLDDDFLLYRYGPRRRDAFTVLR